MVPLHHGCGAIALFSLACASLIHVKDMYYSGRLRWLWYPRVERALIAAFGAEGVGPERLALHAHDTYGQALANVLAALECGVTTLDASAGGLGGCPYAGTATGNLATEDLVWMLSGLGVAHGVDLDALVATSTWLAGHLGRPSPSAVVRARGAGSPP